MVHDAAEKGFNDFALYTVKSGVSLDSQLPGTASLNE